MPLELSLACPTLLHGEAAPPDPHQQPDLPPPNPFPVEPHFPFLLRRGSHHDPAHIVSDSRDYQQISCVCKRSCDCIDAKQLHSSSIKCKRELAIDGMALTLALPHDNTAFSNDQKHTRRSRELGRVYSDPEYTNALYDDQERANLNDGATRGSEEEGACGDPARKKLRLSKESSVLLEERFKEQSTLTPKQKNELAKQLNLQPRQVEVWFQNRRARTKLKQTELDCELLKKCCSSLTEENRRLQMEVAQLRALKVRPHSMALKDFGAPKMPGTTLAMCAHCECISAPAPAPSSSTTTSNSSLHQAPLHPKRESPSAPSSR
ncbi:hypothetical protein L7F22_023559 [Adiantum nelumboides]|nr:hypothetical protein [Adiantum nelumboides]